VYLPNRWKRPGVGKEKRAKAKDYAAMYDSFVPKPGLLQISKFNLLIPSLGLCQIGNECNYNLVNRMYQNQCSALDV
jgi:hypothetical protein